MTTETSHPSVAAVRSTEEQYVEVIGLLEEQNSPVGTAPIAENMQLAMPSVSEMLKRLADKGLVTHAPYEGASLSEKGRMLFANVIRRHRLWEVFLTQHLGMSWHNVYEHACRLEHGTLEPVTARLGSFLGHPAYCPHGSPIPGADGTWPPSQGQPLLEMPIGSEYQIVRILQENDADCLTFLFERDVMIGTVVRLMDIASYDGTVSLDVSGKPVAMGTRVASRLRVTPIVEMRGNASGEST